MKILIIGLCSFAFLSFNSITFAENKQVIDFDKLNKVFYLAKDANEYQEKGLSIKAKKADQEIRHILDSIFVNGKQISSTDSCLFVRDTFKRETLGGENRYFRLNCYESPITHTENYKKNRIFFKIFSQAEINTQHNATSSAIIEKFEESKLFSGKIIITKVAYFGPEATYSFNRQLGFGPELEVFCKIVSFTPSEKQLIQDNNNVLSPGELLRKLESGDNVPKSEIIKTLKCLIRNEN
ncbi:MAG: hypothetical protein KBA61_00140 [Spirochaetes bacterium]|nr:hypothetical protein [Spirochaetota bacterium]